jgi:pimeloyl-ACP methyl ester carboxylesterase/predicted glycosyltransferase
MAALYAPADAPAREQTRARYPDRTGYVERDGVRVFYEVYGSGAPTVLLLPTWSIVHSRAWKLQIPYLARHCRVVTFDGRGNGRSDRPREPAAYEPAEFAADALAVLEATDTERAFVLGFSSGAPRALLLAADHPDLVAGIVFIGPAVPLGEQTDRAAARDSFSAHRERYEGWQRFNRHYWLEHYPEFAEFFCSRIFPEAHSTKPVEDCVAWALETSPETLIATVDAAELDEAAVRALAGRITCPVLVIHGTEDGIRSLSSGAKLAEVCGGTLAAFEGSGHAPHARDPVRTNLVLRDFIAPPSTSRWARAPARGRRALYISSPIGLGHARRDVAIARELRRLHPDLEIEWLAQHPVTAVLERAGERIHPVSAQLAGECGHIEAESSGHALHAFQALRRMDEILLANFMVFLDVVRDEPYDVWIGDEAWEVDYFLHENPELKTAPFAWLTDFVGWLPMAEGGEREAFLTADYNAEMLQQIARFPRIRDRAVFIGEPEDIVPDRFGPGLPAIREWTRQHYAFSGYVTGFDPVAPADRAALRAELGYGPEERICIVTAGGSGVGRSLLRRVLESFPAAARLVPGLRMIAVAGPRIDLEDRSVPDGVEVCAYVPDLHRHLAACDVAVVQGGLTTTMELTAAGRPFLYFPLAHHFEQNLHVRHRLERYGAGRCMDFERAGPDDIATAIAEEIGRDCRYRPVPAGGAARAATLIAELLR